jgi:hypothetical protein
VRSRSAHESGIAGDDERESANQAVDSAGAGLIAATSGSGSTGLELASLLHHFPGRDLTQDQRSQGVAERTEGVQINRFSTSVEATERELRLCGFALLSHFLTMHHVIAEHVRLQPIELLILIATTTGNVQRALRPEMLPEALRGSKPLPPELAVPMSRRAIARVTGIPTETVRRHVESMVERGILVATPKGVRAPNRLTERWAAAATLQLIESHAACTEKLVALQAIVPQPPRSAKSSRA